MNILIIGSDSYIARKFISCYAGKFSLFGISRFSTGFSNEIILPDLHRISICQFENISTIINFAAIVHRPDIKSEKIYDDVNHQLAVLNAQKAKKAGVKLYIQMSTIAVYGRTSNILIVTPYIPQTHYAYSKLKADEELLALQDDNFKVAIIRPPMVYGGGKAPGNMIRLIKLANIGIPLPFKGVDNMRDFIHVQNLVQYLAIIAEKQLSGVYLVTDQQPVSTENVLRLISKYLGNNVPLFHVPNLVMRVIKTMRPYEYEKLFGTLSIKTNFPYEELINRYTIEQGIAEMVEWYESAKTNK